VAQAKLESSSMSISGRSAVGAPVRPSTTSAVMSCGASETRSSKMRRATTRPFSPHTARAVPSAATAIFERPAPAPARLLGSKSRTSGSSRKAEVRRSRRAARTSVPPAPGAVNET
jgi:hypothetical protein